MALGNRVNASRRIRLLEITGRAHGGSGYHILNLVRRLDRSRFDVTVAMERGSALEPEFRAAGLRVVPVGFDHGGGILANARGLWNLMRLLGAERFDVVHTHTSVAGLLGRVAAAACGNGPTVHMLHAFASHAHVPWPKRIVYRLAERGAERLTRAYIAPTRRMARQGAEYRIVPPAKAVVISNAIDLAPYVSRLPDRLASRRMLGLPADALVVGFVGRFEQQKGLAYLVEAAPAIAALAPAVRFLVVGEGALQADIERRIAQLGLSDRFVIVGWQRDVPAVMAAIDMLAMPSLWEAFGLVAAEAMAAGKPVVASDVDGLPEVVEHGTTGLLVPPADPARLASAIVQLAHDPALRDRMGHSGRARALARFNLDDLTRRHEQLFERLARSGRIAEQRWSASRPCRVPGQIIGIGRKSPI